MGYAPAPLSGYDDHQLEGIFGAIGGALKKAGGFVAKKAAPAALSFVPVVGGTASRAYSSLVSPTKRAPVLRRRPVPRRTAPAPAGQSIWSSIAQRALQPRTPIQTVTAEPDRGLFATLRRAAERAARAAVERARTDPELRDRAVDYTARLPAPLIAAAGARQAREAPDYLKASVILPALALAAIVLRR